MFRTTSYLLLLACTLAVATLSLAGISHPCVTGPDSKVLGIYDDDFPAQTGFVPGATTAAIPVSVTGPITIRGTGAIFRSPVGQTTRIGVYTDNAGNPGTLIVESDPFVVPAPGRFEVCLPETDLSIGKYWIASKSDTTTALAVNNVGIVSPIDSTQTDPLVSFNGAYTLTGTMNAREPVCYLFD